MKVYMLVVMFFLIGALFIISENHLALGKSGNFTKFVGMYAGWLGQTFDNTRTLVGYVVKLDWLPGNEK